MARFATIWYEPIVTATIPRSTNALLRIGWKKKEKTKKGRDGENEKKGVEKKRGSIPADLQHILVDVVDSKNIDSSLYIPTFSFIHYVLEKTNQICVFLFF